MRASIQLGLDNPLEKHTSLDHPTHSHQPFRSDSEMASEIAMANFVMNWSKLEMQIELLIWWIINVEPTVGKILTARLDARPKLEILGQLAKRHPKGQRLAFALSELSVVFERLNKARNEAVHGLWFQRKDGKALASSFRIKSEPGITSGRVFSLKELRRYAEICEELKTHLREFFDEVPPLQGTPL